MRISDWSSDVCSSDLIANDVPNRSPNWTSLIWNVSRSGCTRSERIIRSIKDMISKKTRRVRVHQGRLTSDVALNRSEEHTSELQSLMRTSYAVFCLKKKTLTRTSPHNNTATSKTTISKHTRRN